jgi:Tfp pilus assembly protein PilE
MKSAKGYTIVELMVVIFALGCVVLIGLGVYAAAHFIAKFW